MEEIKSVRRWKQILIGKEKSGKSRVAATAPGPILFIDWDGRYESIRGIPNVYVITFEETKPPSLYSDTLTLLTKLENSRDLSTMPEYGFKFDKGQVVIETIVGDSISALSKGALGHALVTQGDIRRVIQAGQTAVYLPNGWDAWNSDMFMVDAVVTRLLALDTNLILCVHETEEYGKIVVWPKRHSPIIRGFNEVWHTTRESGTVPAAQVIPDYKFEMATTTLPINFNIFDPNIAELIKTNGASAKKAENIGGYARPAEATEGSDLTKVKGISFS